MPSVGQKRIVMFVPGLIAFGVYRLAKHLVPITEPLVLLAVSSLVAMVTALLAYRVGRAASWSAIVRQDGLKTSQLAGRLDRSRVWHSTIPVGAHPVMDHALQLSPASRWAGHDGDHHLLHICRAGCV